MTTPTADLLLSCLKLYSSCNNDLALKVRETVLEPFQVDPSHLGNFKPSPSPQKFKQMAVRLAPLAMKIINQNSDTLTRLKKDKPEKEMYNIVVNCLIDTTFYALMALRHMNTLTTLKPLDIEKTTSNIINKVVDLGEYERALTKITKFRVLLADVIRVSLGTMENKENKQKETVSTVHTQTNALGESLPNVKDSPISNYGIPEDMVRDRWEIEMINSYHDLFQLPLNPSINDRTTILLVLAYQMNSIRCFCEIQNGALAKYVPYLFDKPGNFLDWCNQLKSVDPTTASKQFDGIQKTFLRAAKKCPLSEQGKFYGYTLHCLVLKCWLVSKTHSAKLIIDHFVQCSSNFDNNTKTTNYEYIQKYCEVLLQQLEPNIKDLAEYNSYFILCEFYAYISRKLKSYKGAFHAFKYMIRPIRDIIGKPDTKKYYYATYAATAKLSLCNLQMDKMALDGIYIDTSTTFKETISCVKIAVSAIEDVHLQDKHSADALLNFYKSADLFRQSSKRFYEFALEKAVKNMSISAQNPLRTPPRPGEIATPSDFGMWNVVISQLSDVLQSTNELISIGIQLIKTKFKDCKTDFQMDTIIAIFVEIIILLVRIQFQVEDDNSYYKAIEFLNKAEDLCVVMNFSKGYGWIAGSYYSLGAAIIKLNMCSKAIYPIRKSTTLLEKLIETDADDKSKLELCTRYEILGTCCYKSSEFEDATKWYRLGLRQVPVSELKRIIEKGEYTAVSTISKENTLLPKLIDRFLRTSIVDPAQETITFASEHLDLSSFDNIQQGIIYELELKVWNVLSLKAKLTRFQLFIVNELLKYYTPESYPIRRIRVLLERVRIERSKGGDRVDCLRKALEYAMEAKELLKLKDYGNDSGLLSYRRHYLALTTSWIAICGHELKEKVECSFSICFQHWNAILEGISTIYDYPATISQEEKQQVYKEVDDVDRLYSHLRMFTDLFGVIGHYTYQINALRLLLKLNNGLRGVKTDNISESVTVTCEIAKIYCNLGYTGKASIEYERAKNAISKSKCSSFAELTFLVNYSQYLASINDFEKSKEIFEKAKFVWIHNMRNEPKNMQSTSTNFITKSIILSEAYLTKAMFRSDTIDSGINNTTSALHILNKCIKTFQQEDSTTSTQNKDPFSNEKSNKKSEQHISNGSFKESQWRLAQKLAKCMEIMSHLYLKKGSWNEAKYFVRQGFSLAQKLQSKSMLYYAHICSSDFNLRCGDLVESEKDLEKSLRYLPKSHTVTLDQVYLDVAMANVSTAQKLYDQALKFYDKANKSLDTLSSSKYISALEKVIISKEYVDNYMDVDTNGECIPLVNIQTSNTIQKAAIYAYKRNYKAGVSLLEQLEKSELCFDEFQFNTTMGHLKLELALEEITKYDSLKQQDIKCLPAMNYVFKAARRGALKEDDDVDTNLCVLWENLAYYLEKMMTAFQSGINRERLMAINRVCNDTGFSIFLKNQIEVKTKDLVSNNAWSSAYYLEMAKGLHARRLIQTCLTEKIQKLDGYLPPSHDNWPSDEAEKPRTNALSFTPEWLHSHLLTLSQHYSKDHLLDDTQFQQEYVDIIPKNWTVCSLTLDPEHNNLYAIQLRTGEAPFVIKLSLDRMIKKSSSGSSFQEIDIELKSIIGESDDTIQYSAQCKSPDEVKQWWSKRSSLDTRLKTLLNNVQEWFGGFKGILSGHSNESLDDVKKFCDQLNELVHKIVMKVSMKKAKVEFSLHFCRIILQLGKSPTLKELEDVVSFALSCYEEHSIHIGFDQVGKEIIKGLSTLISSYHNISISKGIDTKNIVPNDHVILILDKYMQTLPMENIPILRKQAVSRLPCLSFLRDRILYAQAKKASESVDISKEKNIGNDLHISKKNAYYVLNPSGDLVDTQKEFEKLFKSFQDWNGLAGIAPMELQCKDALQSRDLYMYFGHSAGQSFLKGTTVRNLPKCAVSLLMGCSSGKMESNGEYDPHGYILNYLVAGSPAVVGNLWDVTDRSIDKVTKHMLESWGVIEKSKGKSLVQAITESRDKCNLKYLIGAAPVVYGVPVYL